MEQKGRQGNTCKQTSCGQWSVGVIFVFFFFLSLPATGDGAYTDYYVDMESKTGFANEESQKRKLDRDI